MCIRDSSDIKQIPGVTSLVWALHNKMPGEIWEIDEIQKVADQIHAYGFDMDVVESVNVHDDIKIGLPTRDQYIENYKQCICNLSKFGVKVICYNFMPIFDWTRTDLFHPVGDGSTALFYEKDKIKGEDVYKRQGVCRHLPEPDRQAGGRRAADRRAGHRSHRSARRILRYLLCQPLQADQKAGSAPPLLPVSYTHLGVEQKMRVDLAAQLL